MPEEAPPPRPIGLLAVLLAAILATSAKAFWALNSSGTIDTVLFFIFGQRLHESNLANLYANDPMFNHTPLTGWLMEGLYVISGGSTQSYPGFASALRMLCMGADLGVVAAMLYLKKVTGRPPWWALVVLAASPVSIMVSGFHGNVDPIMVMFIVGAAVALLTGRPVWCGVLLGLAANVKVMPLLLGPLFFCAWLREGRRAVLGFSVAAAAVLLLGAAVPLIQCPAAFTKKVLNYGSYFGTWGFTYWLHETGRPEYQVVDFKNLSSAQTAVIQVLKAIIIAWVLALAWRRRLAPRAEFLTTLAAAFAAMFAFAPGAGPQYLVWSAPFLAWSACEWYLAVTVCSALFMAVFYHSTSNGDFPWDFVKPKGPEIATWGPWMNYPWLTFVLFLSLNLRRWWRVEPARALPSPVHENPPLSRP